MLSLTSLTIFIELRVVLQSNLGVFRINYTSHCFDSYHLSQLIHSRNLSGQEVLCSFIIYLFNNRAHYLCLANMKNEIRKEHDLLRIRQ